MLLASVERREKLQVMLNLSLNQMLSSVLAKQIHKFMHCTDPKTWDGDMSYDDNNGELLEGSDYDPTSEPMSI